MTSPYLMSIMLDTSNWQSGYRVIFIIQSVIAAIMLLSLPLWKKAGGVENAEESQDLKAEPLSYLTMVKTPKIRLVWLMCIAINAIEGVVGIWGATYLVNAHGLTEARAAGAITLFYIGIAGGRFLSGILSNKISERRLITLGTAIMMAGIASMLIPLKALAILGLFLVGLGNGPVYPNIMHLTPENFGKAHSNSVVGSQMATAYFGIMIAPPIFGFLAKWINAGIFPIYIGIWGALFILAAAFFLKKMKAAPQE
jgi:fucose permease